MEARGKAVKGGGKAVKSRGKAVQFVGKCPLTRWPQRRTTGAEASPPQPDVHLDRDRKGSRRLRDARQKRLRNGSETHSSTLCRAYCDDALTVDRPQGKALAQRRTASGAAERGSALCRAYCDDAFTV